MNYKPRLQKMLAQSHQFTLGLLSTFSEPEQWRYQLYEKANHALWILGHLAIVDDFALDTLGEKSPDARAEYGQLFGMKTEPLADASAYPQPSELMAYYTSRREQLHRLVESLSEATLAEAAKPGGPPVITDNASAVETIAWHQQMHNGQLTLIRRKLGMPAIFA